MTVIRQGVLCFCFFFIWLDMVKEGGVAPPCVRNSICWDAQRTFKQKKTLSTRPITDTINSELRLKLNNWKQGFEVIGPGSGAQQMSWPQSHHNLQEQANICDDNVKHPCIGGYMFNQKQRMMTVEKWKYLFKSYYYCICSILCIERVSVYTHFENVVG